MTQNLVPYKPKRKKPAPSREDKLVAELAYDREALLLARDETTSDPPFPLVPASTQPSGPRPLSSIRSFPSPVVAYLALHSSGPSKATARAGLRVLAKLLAKAPTPTGTGDYETVPWWTLTRVHTQYLRDELGRMYPPETANLRLAELRGVMQECALLEDQDGRPLMTFDAMSRARPKDIKGESLHRGRMLEPFELKALFQVCEGPLALRDRAMLALLFGCGLRRSELVTAKREGYREVIIDGRGSVFLRVMGKGNKERDIPVPPIARKHVDAWIEERGDEPGPIVHACRGSKLSHEGISATGIYERLKVLADLASVDCTTHDLRRTYASMMIDQKGVDVFTVSKLLGHVKLETTMKYDKRGERAKREAAEGFEVPE